MPNLLTVSTMMTCPHGGMVQAITTNSRVSAGGDFVLRQSDTFIIAGCPFMIGSDPSPCVQVQWVSTAEQSQTQNDLNLHESAVGLCVAVDNAVQGTVLITTTQPRVSGN